jgi:hypothetical protein
MPLSFRTATFQEAYQKLDEELQQGQIQNRQDIDKRLKELGYDFSLEEFQEAARRQEQAEAAGETDFRPETTAVGRIAGRMAGEIGRGAVDFGKLVLPEDVQGAVSEAADMAGEYIPEAVKEMSGEIFDPYHGSGLQAGGEEIIGTIGAFIVPGSAIIKGVNAASKTARAMSPAARAITTKTARKLSRKQRQIAQAAGRGTGYAAGATFVAPEENLANVIVEEFPETEQYLSRLASNPDDNEAETILKTFATNLGLGAVFAPLAVASAYKKGISDIAALPFKPLAAVKDKLPQIKYLPASLSSRLGTDDTVLALAVERGGAAKAATIRAEGLAKDLKEVVKKEYGKETPELVEKLNNALAGKGLNTLKPETRKLVKEMRGNITGLSKELLGDAKGELKAKISKNLNTYMTRSYDLFDDPDYGRNIRKKWKKYLEDGTDEQGVFAAAEHDLQKAGVQDGRIALNKLINKEESEDGILGVLASLTSHGGSMQTSKSGMKRNEKLPQSVRDLLGEVKDPYGNYVKTFSNLSEITAQQRYAKDIAEHLDQKGLMGKVPEGQRTAELSGASSERLNMIFGGKGAAQLSNPLQGVYVTPEYKRAITEGLELANPAGEWAKVFMRAKGITQAAKTVYSPITHGRNVMGNTIMIMSNGMLPGTKYGQAAKAIAPTGFAKTMLGKTNKELSDRYARYVELGIANSGIGINLVRRNLAAFDTDAEKWLTSRSILSPAKKLNKNVTDLYQAEDDFFKIAHFEKTLDYIKKSKKYKDLPLAEQERVAAQRTRDLMPNYNLVPRAIKQLRGAPVGDFLSFPAEMTRISKNLVKYTLDDLTSNDAVLFAQGAKRAAGITAAGLMGDYIHDFSRNMAGISEEQEEAVNNLVPQWEFNQNRIYLSGIDEDERGHMGVDYVNLGPIDPFSYLKTMGKGMHQIVNSSMGYDDKSDAELGKIALGTFDAAVGPFLDTSMITDAMIELTDIDRLSEETTAMGKVTKAIEPLADVITPGVYDLLRRRAEYNKSLKKRQLQLDDPVDDNLLTDYGLVLRSPTGPDQYAEKSFLGAFPEGEVDLPASLGIKRQRADFTAGTNFAIRPVIGEIDNAGTTLYRYLRESNLLPEDAPKITEKYVNAQRQRLIGYEKLRALLDNYKALYGDDYEYMLERGLTLGNVQKLSDQQQEHLDNAMFVNPMTGKPTGYFQPFVLKNKDMYDRKGTPIPWDSLTEIYNSLDGAAIDDFEED